MIRAKKKPCDGEDCNGALQVIWKNDGGKRYCQRCWMKTPRQRLKKQQNQQQKQRTPISPRSSKRARQDIAYSALRKSFLDAHPACMINIPGICSGKRTNQVHHSYSGKDRDKYYLDTTTWFATEDNCHRWVHENPKEARELGVLK